MIDLFAGAGGLTLGLTAAGFNSILAVEKSEMAAETYFRNFCARAPDVWRNHLSSAISDQISNGLAVASTEQVLDRIDDVRRLLRGRELDLLAGGPPCQGFSMAGLRNPADQRNRLPFEFLEFVKLLEPRVVLIENVAGIGMSFVRTPGRAPLEHLRDALSLTGRSGYAAQILEVNAMHFGVPQHRPRVMIVGLRGDLAELASGFPAASVKADRWSSGSRLALDPLLAPAEERAATAPPTVKEVLADLEAVPVTVEAGGFAAHMQSGEDFVGILPADEPGVQNHVTRRHSARTTARFRLYIAMAPYRTHGNAFRIAAQASGAPDVLGQLITLLERAEVPEPLLDVGGGPLLDELGTNVGASHTTLAGGLIRLATMKHSQRALAPDRPAPTMLSLPDDFVHYAEPRTLTVREMARIQSFPDRFVFYNKETTGAHRRRFEVPQYTQVGNAVPPLLARAVGRHIVKLLEQVCPLPNLEFSFVDLHGVAAPSSAVRV